ncbi:hypothetical protein [Methylobacterium sp. ARG-1]|uniref:hypothetical protein n=1 Tax=Methylobacterium sp. ARG-1 TaxID=1692501 RepID=UPI0011875187|nr:hypothetical protein [Methylobacterium sp. ARG-1]
MASSIALARQRAVCFCYKPTSKQSFCYRPILLKNSGQCQRNAARRIDRRKFYYLMAENPPPSRDHVVGLRRTFSSVLPQATLEVPPRSFSTQSAITGHSAPHRLPSKTSAVIACQNLMQASDWPLRRQQ